MPRRRRIRSSIIFFRHNCQVLPCLPQLAEYPNYFHTLAVKVPFRERYQPPVYLNNGEGALGEDDTRLFTVECASHVLVAWCGTDSQLNDQTDVSFGPKRCPAELGGMGNVHGGFLEAYQLTKRKFEDELDAVNKSL